MANKKHKNFSNMFSMPREPAALLSPGQHFEMSVPHGKKVLITDVYIENLGDDTSVFRILKQSGPNSFEVRYTFRTTAHNVTVINFTTGLKLGDESPIEGSIRIENAAGSQANLIPRVNGVFVR